MTLQAALAEVLLVGLPVILLGLGALACAYYVIRPRTLATTDRLIEELVAESLDQLIAQLRDVQPQPVVVSNRLHNVPERGTFSWDPGAQFGMYRMDEFWFDQSR